MREQHKHLKTVSDTNKFNSVILLIIILPSITGPNGSPAILEANSTSTTSINVQWEMVPLILRNGIITNYSIILKPYVTANQSTVEHVTTELNATVGDLIPHTLYNITVAALTRIGRGPPSTPVEMVMTPQDCK